MPSRIPCMVLVALLGLSLCGIASANLIIFSGRVLSCGQPVANVIVRGSGCFDVAPPGGAQTDPVFATTNANGEWAITNDGYCFSTASNTCTFTVDTAGQPYDTVTGLSSFTTASALREVYIPTTFNCSCSQDPYCSNVWGDALPLFYEPNTRYPILLYVKPSGSNGVCPATNPTPKCTPSSLSQCPAVSTVSANTYFNVDSVDCDKLTAVVSFKNSLYKKDCTALSWVTLAVKATPVAPQTVAQSTICAKTDQATTGQTLVIGDVDDVPCGSTIQVFGHDGSWGKASSTNPNSISSTNISKLLPNRCMAGKSEQNCGPYGNFVVTCSCPRRR